MPTPYRRHIVRAVVMPPIATAHRASIAALSCVTTIHCALLDKAAGPRLIATYESAVAAIDAVVLRIAT